MLAVIDLPVYAHIFVPAEFNLTTCELRTLPAWVTVPSDIGGNPIDIPTLPPIPGLPNNRIPGVRELLALLVPALNRDALAALGI